MKVEVEKVSGSVAKVSVEIPPSAVDLEIDKQFRVVAKHSVIPGFRPGKAPRALIEKKFATTVRAEAAVALVKAAYPRVLAEHGLRVLSEPEMEVDDLVPGEPFRFRFRCEIKPQVEVKGYQDIALSPEVATVNDADVDAELERLRQAKAQVVAEDDPLAKADIGSVVTVDWRGNIEGAPFPGGSREDVQVELGQGRLPAAIEDRLVGATVGSDLSIETVLSEQEAPAEFVGKTATFAVHVKALGRKVLPALNDEFAADLGAENLDNLRQLVRARIEAGHIQADRQKREERLIELLSEANPFDLPEQYVSERAQILIQSIAERFSESKEGVQTLRQGFESNRELFEDRARREIRRHLLLEAVASAEGITVTDELLDQEIERFARASGQNVAHARARLRGDARTDLAINLLERRTLDFLLTRAAQNAAQAGAPAVADIAAGPSEAVSEAPAAAPEAAAEPVAVPGDPGDDAPNA